MQPSEVVLAQAPCLSTLAAQELPPAPGGFDMPPFLPLVSVGVVGVLGMAEPPKSGVMMTASVLADNARRGPQPTMCDHQMPRSNKVQEMSGLGVFIRVSETVYYQSEGSLQSDLSSYQ